MMTITAPFTARISTLFNQVRSKVRTEITLLKLVSSQVSTENAIYNHAYHERKSLLLAGIKLILHPVRAREGNNCHQDNDNVTKTVTLFITETATTLYQISKTFTKIGKANNDFKDTLGREFSDILGRANKIIFGPHKKGDYLAELANFSRQVAITQAEKLVLSFFACSSICSRRSWGKRIPLVNDLLFLYPVAITNKTFVNRVSKHYTAKNIIKKALTCICTIFYSVYAPNECIRLKKAMPRSGGTLSRHLTKPLNEVMIMANRYDSVTLCAEQSKLFKFYDLSTAKVLETLAPTERQARKNLGKQSIIFIARIQLYPTVESSTNWGGISYA